MPHCETPDGSLPTPSCCWPPARGGGHVAFECVPYRRRRPSLRPFTSTTFLLIRAKDRLMAAVDRINRHPVVHTWTYKLDRAA